VFIDKSHLRWALAVVLAAGGLCWLKPAAAPFYGEFATRFWFGLAGCLCCVAAQLLGLRGRLAGKRVKLGTWQKIHIWVGLLSVPMVLVHAGLDWGYCWNVGRWLASTYLLILATGLVALVAMQLGPLVKYADKGRKAQVAARWIELLKEVALFLHLPLTGAFWPLLFMHVWGKIYY
jgi:hypothetical protein